jgi:hypothetical protein
LDRGTRRPGDQPRWLTSGTLTSASIHGSDHVDRVKTEDVQVERGSEDFAAGCSRTAVTRVEQRETRMEYAIRKRVWWFGPQSYWWRVYGFGPQNLGGCFRGGTDGTWRHQGVRVEAKLLMRRRGGRQMKMTPGWTITLLG